jgi:drug/metabolite transporter (DMT)-like permease
VQLRIVLAFAATWLIWGSTYLAVAFAVRDIPPFIVAGLRNTIAGIALYLWMRSRGAARPTARQWGEAVVVGVLLLGGGNGAVTWAAAREPSGVVALMVSLVPLWMMVFGWVGRRGVRPSPFEVIGVAIGLAGIALLVSTDADAGGSVSLLGAIVLICSTIAWSIGSMYSRQLETLPVPLLGTGMEMLSGGIALFIASAAFGEWGRVDFTALTLRGFICLVYLIVFGSIIGFSAYKWLLGRVRPALAGTYAFVNPVVAVLLGSLFAGEAFTPRLAVAMLLIVGAVAMISLRPYFSRR